MATLTLHPIQHGFENDNGDGMETVILYPEHLRGLFISEYQFMRRGGATRRHARWHVWRMLAMIWDGKNGWFATDWDEQELDDLAGWTWQVMHNQNEWLAEYGEDGEEL